MWEALNSFYLALGRYDLEAALATGPYSVYQEVKERCALFWGLLGRTMLRDEGRSFLEAGGRIEEADMVLRMLRVAAPTQSALDGEGRHEAEALGLLQAVGGFQAYRRCGAPGTRAAAGRALPPVRGGVSGLGRLLAGGAADGARDGRRLSRAPRRRCCGWAG